MQHDHNSETSKSNESKNQVDGEIEAKTIHNGFQMPANMVAAEFGEINVWRSIPKANSEGTECRVEFTIAMEPQGRFAEGWRTGLALDASASMKRAYGRKVEARVDPELLTDYIKQGRLRAYLEDGEPIRKIEREAFAEIQDRGYEINFTTNILQPLVQDFTAYLAGSLDGTGKTSLIYWGCGNGDEIQVLGEFDEASCQQLAIAGPPTFKLGKTTKLLPAIAYFADQYRQSPRGIYIFLTDGRIDDLEQVKNYTKELALEIAVGKRNYLKLILIGVGNEIDRYQLQELDNFDTGLDLDLWDYKIADEMTSLSQIFAEVVNENQIIAESASIYDDAGVCVKSYNQGLPTKVDFVMRDDSQWFELEVGDQRIRQGVSLGIAAAIAPLAKKQLMDFEIKAQEHNQALVNAENKKIQVVNSNGLWKILLTLLIGTTFICAAIAFIILNRRSEDHKLPNQNIPKVTKESVIQTKETSKSNPNSISKDKSDNLSNPAASSNSSKNNPVNNLSINKSGSQFTGNNLSFNFDDQSTIKTDKTDSPKATNKPANPANIKSNKSEPIDNNIDNKSSKNLVNNSSNSAKIPANTSVNVAENKSGNNSGNITKSIVPITNPDLEMVVFFPSDESQLIASEETKLDDFWTKIRNRRGIIQVSGHTDKTGDYGYNLDLSQLRANEVVRLLRDRGLDNNYQVVFEALSWLQPLRKDTITTDNVSSRRVVVQFKEQR